jgi:poly(hydroxyalkanoate) depolymerase family esterase
MKFPSRSFQRTLRALTRSVVRAGTKAVAQAFKPRKIAAAKPSTGKATPGTIKARSSARSPAPAPSKRAVAGRATAMRKGSGYQLFAPPGIRRNERVSLLVMLHGCGQSAEGFAASTRMNQIALRERFLVLYPEQNRIANLQGCWNWHQTRSGQAQAEADAINAKISQVCKLHAVDPQRIAVAGFSAGAGMAALLATRHPERFCALAMHSGIAAGVAHSTPSALAAMRGLGVAQPLAALAKGLHLPPLLVLQGSTDNVVAPSNGAMAAHSWATLEGAKATTARKVQRGKRYPVRVTDYRARGRLVVTLCDITGLAHAWSGGAASQAFSDPKGPDASRMVWSFVAKQFAATAPLASPLHERLVG